MSYGKKQYSKYHNKKTNVEGIAFDSKKEAGRYLELLMLEKSGLIKNLKRQVKFEIVPKLNRVKRTRFYVADFVYERADGKKVIEDVKSPITKKNPVYTLKRDLVLWQYPDYQFVES